jgi:Tfp pilus assembly protein PilV
MMITMLLLVIGVLATIAVVRREMEEESVFLR